jgi:hypothetical protein
MLIRDNRFQSDPLLASLVEKSNLHVTSFGLVCVAGWPPCESMRKSYKNFVLAVRGCFEDNDVQGSTAPVYIYPFESLHVTVATFSRTSFKNLEHQEVRTEYAKKVVMAAAEDANWPKHPLELQIDNAQIGDHAGILLWKETTGRLDMLRECIRKASSMVLKEVVSADISAAQLHAMQDMLRGITIPPIVHSTFLRFYKTPVSPARMVQEKFCERVVKRLLDLYPKTLSALSVALVCEYSPYMHIPYDKQHVLAEYSMTL